MEALKLRTSPADLLQKIFTPDECVKTRFKEIPRPPLPIIVSSPSPQLESVDRLSTDTNPTPATEPSPATVTGAGSISQSPEVFVVQKFYFSPDMTIDEKILEVWTRQIKSRLSGVLRRNIPSGTCVQEFMMVGKRPNALKPTVVITCGDPMTKKRVEKIFKSQVWLQELMKANQMVFIALVAKTSLSAGPVSDNDCIETLRGSYAVQLPQPGVPTSCGLELSANGMDIRQRCTLGGLLVVNGRVLGLTAGHPFSQVEDNFLQRKPLQAAEYINEFNDEDSSSVSSEPFVFTSDSDDDENDDLVSTTAPSFEHVDTLPSLVDRPAYDRHEVTRASSSIYWSAPQIAIIRLPTQTNGSSIDNFPDSFDWALLESLPSAVIMQHNAIFDAGKNECIPIKGILSSRACGKVVVAAAGVESHQGYLHDSPAAIQVNGSVLEVQLVVMNIILPLGSSGAWVVREDKLCGYIVAIRQDVPWAYMVAIQPVLEDIGRKFKTDNVRLPTVVDIESFRIISQNKQPTWSNEQEGTQAFEIESNHHTIPTSGLKDIRKAQNESASRYLSEDIDETQNESLSMIARTGSIPAQNRSVNEKCHASREQDEVLNEKSSRAADPPWPLENLQTLPGPVCVELPGEEPEVIPYPTLRRVSIHSSSNPNNDLESSYVVEVHSLSRRMTLNLERPAQEPKIKESTANFASFLRGFRQSVKSLGHIWHRFESLILRTEYRRRREKPHSPVFLVRMTWEPMMPDYNQSWIVDSMQQTANAVFMFVNILLNFLYWILLFPFILWVLYHHHDVIERPRPPEQLQASIEMLGRLPFRYHDYDRLEHCVRHSFESR